jgi:hypothetical protein
VYMLSAGENDISPAAFCDILGLFMTVLVQEYFWAKRFPS